MRRFLPAAAAVGTGVTIAASLPPWGWWPLAFVAVPAAAPGRWLALPGAVGVLELFRWSWPFGGVPLSSLAVGQVAGPLAPVLRIGGAVLLVEAANIPGGAPPAALR